jgi:Ni,Fe-hydrogenase I small subunit
MHRGCPRTAEGIGCARAGLPAPVELRRLLGRAAEGGLRVIWLHGAGDPGCSRALVRAVRPDLAEAIADFRSAADIRPTVFLPSSDRALSSLSHALAGRTPLDLLIVEGAAPADGVCGPAAASGRLVPFETWVRDLAAVAKRVVAVGTCAGRSIAALAGVRPLLTIPGCPAPAERILLALAALLSASLRGLAGRPRGFRRPRPETGPLGRLASPLTR